jgi:arabinofuranosyltransferase
MDDALITYRYSRHLGQGLGPYWNVTGSLQPVEGFSSFLHMFLLGGLHAVTRIDVEWLGKMSGLFFALMTILSIAVTARRAALTAAGVLVAMSPFLLPPMVMATASGMETALFVFFAWMTPMACWRVLTESPTRQRVASFVVLALLGTLTRPEFAANALALFALTWWRRPALRRELVTAVFLWYVLPGLALTGWRIVTYGDVVPNTFYVKQRLPGLWGLGYVWRFVLICAVPYLLIAAPSMRWLWREHRDLLLVALVSVGVPCLYFTSVRPLMGWWYRFLIPHLAMLAWVAAVGLSYRPAARSWTTAVPRWSGAALIVIFALAQVPPILNDVPGRHADDARLAEVGRRLRPWAAADRTLSYYDIGRLPYEAEWTVVDVVGLTTSRKDLRGDCGNKTDLLLRSMTSSPPRPLREIENPCPKLYEPLLDLEFFVEEPILSRRMRVFVRKDLTYKEPLRQALENGWPEPDILRGGWLVTYSAMMGGWFGR